MFINIIFWICNIIVFILCIVKYSFLINKNFDSHCCTLIFSIICILGPSFFTIIFTFSMIGSINIKNYYTTNEDFINLMKEKKSELNERTIKMVFSLIMVLSIFVILILEIMIMQKDKEPGNHINGLNNGNQIRNLNEPLAPYNV